MLAEPTEVLLQPEDPHAASQRLARLRADNDPGEVTGFGLRTRESCDPVLMMVDDEPLNLEVLQALLEDAGYRRFVPTSAPLEAMSLIAEHRPDVVLLDLMMPGISGFDILELMRADDGMRHIPVVVLTSSTDAETKLKALELGATDFLAKPVDPSELALRLRNTLSAKAYRDRLANYDHATGLPNRRLFIERLERALRATAVGGPPGVVMQIALDRFKQFCDAFGVAIADSILKAVALRLDLGLRASGVALRGAEDALETTLYHLGGDEFAVLLVGKGPADAGARVAEALLAGLAEPFRAGGQELSIGAAIGISTFPNDGMEAITLLGNAGTATRTARDQAGTGYRFYSPELNSRSLKRLSIETELRRAIERDELVVYFQPKVRVATGRATSAEALVRWRHPERGLVSPNEFIGIAEETGLIVPLGDWMLRAVCAHIVGWKKAGLRVPRISVNVSGQQFRGQRLVHSVRSILSATGAEPRHLAIEITESVMMEDAQANARTLHELKELGLTLAIDDFGTGYSSLAYLKRFPLDELKIDRSFVTGVDTDPDNHAIVAAIVAMAHSLGLYVVAEGVETQAQLGVLKLRNCDEAQGYLFSKPIAAEGFGRLLHAAAAARSPGAPATASQVMPVLGAVPAANNPVQPLAGRA